MSSKGRPWSTKEDFSPGGPDEWPSSSLFSFQKEDSVTIQQCGDAMSIGADEDGNLATKVQTEEPWDYENSRPLPFDEKDKIKWIKGQWNAIPGEIDGKIVCKFRSRKTGKYLQIHKDGKVDLDENDGKLSIFRIKRLGHSVILESNEFEGKHLSVNAEYNKVVSDIEKPSDGDKADECNYGFLSFQVVVCADPIPSDFELVGNYAVQLNKLKKEVNDLKQDKVLMEEEQIKLQNENQKLIDDNKGINDLLKSERDKFELNTNQKDLEINNKLEEMRLKFESDLKKQEEELKLNHIELIKLKEEQLRSEFDAILKNKEDEYKLNVNDKEEEQELDKKYEEDLKKMKEELLSKYNEKSKKREEEYQLKYAELNKKYQDYKEKQKQSVPEDLGQTELVEVKTGRCICF